MVTMYAPENRMDDARAEVPGDKMLIYEVMGEVVFARPGTRILSEEHNPTKFYAYCPIKATIIVDRKMEVPEGTIIEFDPGNGQALRNYMHGERVPLSELLAGRVIRVPLD